jgi:hypothetical protein
MKRWTPMGLLLCALVAAALAWRGYFTPAIVIHLLGVSFTC